MNNQIDLILTAARSADTIPADTVLSWMSDHDLRVRGAVYFLLMEAGDNVAPPIAANESMSFMLNYLFDCLVQNPDSEDHLHSGFEAAWDLAAWVTRLADRVDTQRLIKQVVQKLTDEYRVADTPTRNRIETGVVEHLMEKPSLRPYFSSWKDDPVLAEAYRLCLLWGETNEQK
jgi:hypothetical protein